VLIQESIYVHALVMMTLTNDLMGTFSWVRLWSGTTQGGTQFLTLSL